MAINRSKTKRTNNLIYFIMKHSKISRILIATCFCVVAGLNTISAQNGNPHSLTGEAKFNNVVLNWQAPATDITLQWHDGEDYNGTDGVLSNPQGSVVYYVANKFTKEDLKNSVGEVIDSMSFFEYRPAYKVTALIYENGTPVVEQNVDLSNFTKNTVRKFALSSPYTIPAEKELMFVIKYEYGSNQDFMAICDKSPTPGKGNLYSYDGKTWNNDGPGDYLVTAYIKNNTAADATPDGYNVYRDGVKVNEAPISDTSVMLNGEATGTHQYYVTAVYGATENQSKPISLSCTSVTDFVPSVSTIMASKEDLNGTIEWTAPLSCSNEITWSSKEYGNTIGGTGSSPKVWIKQEFDANDMIAYPNHKITAINSFINGPITGITLFVIKNGVIDYHQPIEAAALEGLVNNSWNKFTLTTPYKFEVGNQYSFGIYYTHAKGEKPIAVDNSTCIDIKGNSFSTSSPKSAGFEKTTPSWKTLASGNIPGNFMLTADIEADGEVAPASEITGYDIYRDGNLIASDVKELKYTDTVTDLGTYLYGVVSKGKDGKVSPVKEISITYTLPATYEAPVILSNSYENNELSISYTADAYELKHYGTPAYLAGFEEEMPDLLYGAKFTKEELADYVGYEFNSLKFAIGSGITTFNLEVYESGNTTPIYSEKMEGIEAGYLYTTSPSSKIVIPENKDLYLVYKATLPAGASGIILDEGPARENGAVVSLSGGANWLKLGTISPDLKDYNIVISAIAVPASDDAKGAAKAKQVVLGNNTEKLAAMPKRIISKVNAAADSSSDEFGIEAALKTVKKAAKKAADTSKVLSYRVYCNNEIVYEGAATTYTETISDYGVFNYHVTAIFEKGWESPASRTITVENEIKQAAPAPFDLVGYEKDEKFNLAWKSVSEAPVLKVHNGDIDWVNGCGMTHSSGTSSGYQTILIPAADVADKAGMEISHIRFGLLDPNVYTASVIVMKNENVVYEQAVDVATLVKGWNEVRLNTPVTIEAGQDLYVGYHLSYKSGLHPLAGDKGPAVPGYGDLISSSGSNGYWYSMKNKYKLDFNWVIEAVLKTPNTSARKAPMRADDAVTYNVYCDGVAVATGLTTTSYVAEKGAYGDYTVTAVTAGVESAESNVVSYVVSVGIDSVEGDNAAENTAVYSIDGQLVNKSGKVNALKKGLYIVNGKKYVVK